MTWSSQHEMPASGRRMRFWAWLLGYAVVLLLAVTLVSALLAGYARKIPGSASVDPAFAAQGEVFDAAVGLALAPAVDFTGSFSSDTGERIQLDARVSNEGSMVATLTIAGQEAEFLATGDRRFVRASAEVWTGLDVSAADAALYGGIWTQVDNDFLGIDLPSMLAPQRLAWTITGTDALHPTGAPGAVEQVNGVPARPIQIENMTVWLSEDQPQRIVRVRSATDGQRGDLVGRPPQGPGSDEDDDEDVI